MLPARQRGLPEFKPRSTREFFSRSQPTIDSQQAESSRPSWSQVNKLRNLSKPSRFKQPGAIRGSSHDPSTHLNASSQEHRSIFAHAATIAHAPPVRARAINIAPHSALCWDRNRTFRSGWDMSATSQPHPAHIPVTSRSHPSHKRDHPGYSGLLLVAALSRAFHSPLLATNRSHKRAIDTTNAQQDPRSLLKSQVSHHTSRRSITGHIDERHPSRCPALGSSVREWVQSSGLRVAGECDHPP